MDQTWIHFLSFSSLLIGTIAITANFIMILVFTRERKYLRPMHSYLFSDGITNIVTGLGLIAFAVLLVTHSVNSCVTQLLVEGMLIIYLVTGFLSILFIGGERHRTLVLLCAPISHSQRILLIVFIWFIALLMFSVRTTNMKIRPYINQTSDICFVPPEFDSVFTTVLIVSFYLIPTVASVYFYSKIIGKLWKRRRLGSSHHQEKKRQAIKAMVYMLSACAICWLPFCLYRLTFAWMKSYEKRRYSDSLITMYILGCSQSAVSVLIYISYSQDFRQAFKLVFKWCIKPKSRVVVPYQPHFINIRPAAE